MSTDTEITNQFFRDLKVIELASVLAGPAVGMFFAELGAQVIKIENKRVGGDVTRQWKLPGEPEDQGISSYYASVNYGKECHLFDLRDDSDYEKVINWIAEADLVISNFLPRSAKKLKLDYELLRKINPKLIYGQILGYRNQPDRPAFDAILQAEMGFISMSGTTHVPAKMPVAMIDVIAAHQLKEGVLCALLHREKTGRGAYVDAALDEAAISALVNQASGYLMTGTVPQRLGTLHPNISPYGEIVTTSDQVEIMLAVGNDAQFNSLFQGLKLGRFLHHTDFQTNMERLKNRSALGKVLMNVCSDIQSNELFSILHTQSIPFGVVKTLKEVLEETNYAHLILEENDEIQTRCVSSATFKIQTSER